MTGALYIIAPVVTTTYIILCTNTIQNGDILVLANPGPPGKMAVKMERERVRESNIFVSFGNSISW